MIPRTLVPTNVRPPSPEDLRRPARRTTTYMDDRTVVPSELSDAPPLDGKSSIPSHLPLDVLVDRTLVPRGMPAKPIEKLEEAARYSIAVMDERVVVPAYVEPPLEDLLKEFEKLPEFTPELREVVEPDIFITGDPNLLVRTEGKRSPKYDALVRAASLVAHILLIIFLVLSPKIFPYHPPSQEDLDLARHALNFIYMPPETAKPAPPGPKLRISPKILNKVAPPVFAPPVAPPTEAAPARPTPAPELPAAPTPKVPVNPAPAPRASAPAPEPSRIEPIKPQPTNPGRYNLNLPSSSPNRELRDQLQDAIKRQGGGGIYPAPGGGLPRGGGGRGSGQRGPGMQPGATILTPTEGVDFSSYIQRLLATVKRNWYSVMPESAYMGEKGVVSITFHINRDGSVPMPDPTLERTSGREPLDNAALSSIRMSNPFEPLPQQFRGPFIELRFIFFYNLPVDYAY